MLHAASRQRLEHLNQLYQIESLADVKYDEWSRVRLDRLLAEYLVRQGYSDTAKALAREREGEALVDLEVFDRCERIAPKLRKGSLDECLAWCMEHRIITKKMDVSDLSLGAVLRRTRKSTRADGRLV